MDGGIPTGHGLGHTDKGVKARIVGQKLHPQTNGILAPAAKTGLILKVFYWLEFFPNYFHELSSMTKGE